jgi:hypothetical protein
MRIILILLIIVVFTIELSAQTITFNQRRTFGCSNALFSSIEATDSCYYLTGFVRDSQNCQKSFLFVKMDTLGNVLRSTITSNTVGTYESWVSTLQTTKEGNLVTALYKWDSIVIQAGVFELDTLGNLLQSHFYYNPHTVGDFIRPDNMKITKDSGYVFLFTVDNPVDGADISILKIDKYGNEDWHVIRGVVPYIETGKGLYVEEDGSIVIGYRKDNITGVFKNFTIKSVLEKLDSSGNTIWQYESPSTEQVWGVNDLIKTKDCGWVVASALGYEIPVNATSNRALYNGYIYKLDSARTFLWGKEYGSDGDGIGSFSNIIELADSNLIAFGIVERLHPQPNPTHNIIHGRVVKLSAQGDSLWSREYEYLNTANTRHYIYDAERTHDGGFLIAGECLGTGAGVYQQGWLLKLDEEGCLVPGCHITTGVLPIAERPSISLSLYPNPTIDYLNVHYFNKTTKEDLTFSVVDMQGRVLSSFKTYDQSDKTYIVPVSDLVVGVYVLEVRQEGILVGSEQFVKQ